MIDKISEDLKNTEIIDLQNGYFRESDAQVCLFCGERFEDGIVYPLGDVYYTAQRAVQQHIAVLHGEVFEILLGLGKSYTGLSAVQETVLHYVYTGCSDKQIAEAMGGKSVSTIRNQRFHLRQRRSAAKLFLAIMGLLEENEKSFMEFNTSIAVQDERTDITLEEQNQILAKYFLEEPTLTLRGFPRKQKTKLVILNRISELFQGDRQYTEQEVNTLIGAVYPDYITIRRYLIDYGFLDRKTDGSCYWLNKSRIQVGSG